MRSKAERDSCATRSSSVAPRARPQGRSSGRPPTTGDCDCTQATTYKKKAGMIHSGYWIASEMNKPNAVGPPTESSIAASMAAGIPWFTQTLRSYYAHCYPSCSRPASKRRLCFLEHLVYQRLPVGRVISSRPLKRIVTAGRPERSPRQPPSSPPGSPPDRESRGRFARE
jgi:hypothetical protein